VIIIDLSDDLLARCDAKATLSTSGNYAEKYPNSAAVSWGDAQTNWRMWTESKMAECGVCVHLDLDPLVALNWKDHADWYDFRYPHVKGGQPRVDVKETKTQTLFWPINKNSFFADAPVDILVSARARRDLGRVRINGWLSKGEFQQRMKVSQGREGEPREPGTWYVPHERLHSMDIFPGRCKDEREHYCWCGDPVGWYNAHKIKHLGYWVCRRHGGV
jgi:hypothetical protein